MRNKVRLDLPYRCLVLLLLFGLQLKPAWADEVRLMLGFAPGVDPQTVLADHAVASQQLTIERTLGSVYIVSVADGITRPQREALIERLNADPRIRYAEAPGRVRAQFVPNELATSGQWYLTDSYGINAPAAWDMNRGDRDRVVALLDTGILPHEDLQSDRILPGYDFVSDPVYANDGDGRDADPSDPGDAVVADECGPGTPAMNSSWHGLQVAGVLAATADNGIGIAGVDHRARLLPLRVLGKCGGDFVDVLEAMLWAAGVSISGVPDNPVPAQVINMSFSGIGECSLPVQDIIDEVTARGVVIVAAAGNDAADAGQRVPANCRGVIAVTATDRQGDHADYANNGSVIDIAAPGGDGAAPIRTLVNNGLTSPAGDGYTTAIGTSFSAAMVSGAATLLLAENAGLTPLDVLFHLQSGSQLFPAGSTCSTLNCGSGILDMAASLNQLLAASSNTADSANTSTEGGGGGGCVLHPSASGAVDMIWLLFPLWLLSIALRRQGKKYAG